MGGKSCISAAEQFCVSDFYEHLSVGLVLGTLFGSVSYFHYGLGAGGSVAVFAACGLGSLLPDIDHHNSYIHRAVKTVSSIGSAAAAVLLLRTSVLRRLAAGALAGAVVHYTFTELKPPHRGPTHSLAFAGLTGIASGMLGSGIGGLAVGGSAVAGVLSHLALDRELKLV